MRLQLQEIKSFMSFFYNTAEGEDMRVRAEIIFTGLAFIGTVEKTIEWLEKSGATEIETGESLCRCGYRGGDMLHLSTTVSFYHKDHSFYQKLAALRPNPLWPENYVVPQPYEEADFISSKFLWRYVAKELISEYEVGDCGDKYKTFTLEHLPLLRFILANPSEFARKQKQKTCSGGATFITGAVNEDRIVAEVKPLIKKIERVGHCIVFEDEADLF